MDNNKSPKSRYDLIINADANVINQTILDFLSGYEFKQKQEDGNIYFERMDLLSGRRLFEYYISGNQVTIFAYVGSYKHPMELEGVVGALPKQAYKDTLQILFDQLNALNNPQQVAAQNSAYSQGNIPQQAGYAPNNAYPQGNMPQQTPYASNTPYMQGYAMQQNVFQQQNSKNLDKMTIAGFVISIIGLLLAFIGITYGLVIIILEFYFGFKGLKSNKRGLAIATIVLSCLSLLITICLILHFIMSQCNDLI